MEPIFSRDKSFWVPTHHTIGPANESAQHGGALAGVLLCAIYEKAEELGAGQCMMVTVAQMRPAPIEPALIPVTILRQGKRTTYLRSEVSYSGKLTGIATALFSQPMDLPGLPAISAQQQDPGQAPMVEIQGTVHDAPYNRALDMRIEPDGTYWFRFQRPFATGAPRVAEFIALADNATGATYYTQPPVSQAEKDVIYLSTDLTVHFSRPPDGAWVGFRAKRHWFDSGLGLVEAELLDARGELGRVAQSIAVISKENWANPI